jgi:sugar lactone lactonase YvrE
MSRALCTVLLVACAGGDPKSSDSAAGADDTVPLAASYTLEGDTLFPEGIAWSDSERAFFVGSLTEGSIVRVDPDGTQTTVFQPDSGVWMTLGMKVDEGAGELLVCAVEDYGTETPQSVLQRFAVADGGLLEQVELAPGAVCNDVAVAADGRVWITEREGPRLWTVAPGSSTAEVFAEGALLEPEVIGCNGVVVVDENTVLVGKYAPGRILRFDPADPGSLEEVAVGGDGLGSLPDGADGMFLDGDTLLVAANGTWFTVESSDGWASATTTAHTPPAAIAAVTVAEGRRFGLKGEVVPFVLGTAVSLPFEILEL